MRKLSEFRDDKATYDRPMFVLAIGHRWDHVEGMRFMCDAAHLMTPFAGSGANLAMLDGLKLGIVPVEASNCGKASEERDATIAAWEKMSVSTEKITRVS